MDISTKAIRYQQWVEVIREWSMSGMSKKQFCTAKGINEKQFHYYQRCIRNMLAHEREGHLLAEESSSIMPAENQGVRPQIVKLQVEGMVRDKPETISFSLNGMNITVSENIPAPFLAKLLEAANHGTR